MYHLVRLTADDYRDYRKVYENMDFSFFRKGEEKRLPRDVIRNAVMKQTKSRSEFLKDISNPNYEMYFFKDSNGKIQGFLELIFDGPFCNLYELVVFQKGIGLGSLLYNETQKIIKEHNCQKILLWCPFDGAKEFWKKKGFKPKPKDMFFKRI